MTKTEKLLEEINSKWGIPSIDYFGPKRWRVCVRSHHYHYECGYGSFSAQGNNIQDAANRLFKIAKHNKVREDNNCNICSNYLCDGY